MVELVYAVDGMSCAHCAAAVRAEVGAVAGVQDVVVEVDGGTVRVHGDQVADDAVRAAIDEAGYTVRS